MRTAHYSPSFPRTRACLLPPFPPPPLLQIVSLQNHLGGTLDPHACFLLQRGIKTLALRVRQQSANALALAKALEAETDVVRAVLCRAALCCAVMYMPCCGVLRVQQQSASALALAKALEAETDVVRAVLYFACRVVHVVLCGVGWGAAAERHRPRTGHGPGGGDGHGVCCAVP